MRLDTNKPVFLCLHGPSLSNLEREIEFFRSVDAYWMTVNVMSPIEKLLNRIGKTVQMFHTTNLGLIRVKERLTEIKDFILRDDTLLFANTLGAIGINSLLKSVYQEKCEWDFEWYIGEYPTPKSRFLACDFGANLASIFGSLSVLMMLGFKSVFIFGADGYVKDKNEMLYSSINDFWRTQDMKSADPDYYELALRNDTAIVNTTFWMMMDKWGITSWNRDCRIINVNPESRYTAFNKVDIKDVIRFFEGENIWIG